MDKFKGKTSLKAFERIYSRVCLYAMLTYCKKSLEWRKVQMGSSLSHIVAHLNHKDQQTEFIYSRAQNKNSNV